MARGVALMRKHAAPDGAWRVFGGPRAINMALLTELSGSLQIMFSRLADVSGAEVGGSGPARMKRSRNHDSGSLTQASVCYSNLTLRVLCVYRDPLVGWDWKNGGGKQCSRPANPRPHFLQQARHLFQVSMESVSRGKDDPLFHAARITAF